MRGPRRFVSLAWLWFFCATGALAEISVIDDSGTEVVLENPAERIVSLAPNLTELLFAAGAGDKIVGTVSYSDYPEPAKKIPRVGDAHTIDVEALIALAPDLVVLWESGTGPLVRRRLEELGFTIYRAEPHSLKEIASSVLRLGRLGGTARIAGLESRRLLSEADTLRRRYGGGEKTGVFYQFWPRPVYTVNGEHLISRIIELCGGYNVFADLPALTPRIHAESVLERNPDVIIGSGEDDMRPEWLDDWRQWPELAAVSNDRLYSIPPDLIQRPTPRVLEGARLMCGMINAARATAGK